MPIRASKKIILEEDKFVNGVALTVSLYLIVWAFGLALYKLSVAEMLANWRLILILPGPLVTDYFRVGGISATFFNAGICGLFCCFMMSMHEGDSKAHTLAGFFLVIAHCFYGLNLVNMIPCFFAPYLYLHKMKMSFNDNLHICMFTTSFAPFVSELLFRYTVGDDYVQDEMQLTKSGIVLTILFVIALGYIVPAILPGAKAWHNGFNLFNGGLAFGIFGFFLYSLLYRSLGLDAPTVPIIDNPVYISYDHNFILFGNLFFIGLFGTFLIIGFVENGKSFKGYGKLLSDTGHAANFIEKYGIPLSLINIGLYGFMFLGYINFVIATMERAGFTGPTYGVILAAMTFSVLGQHPRNVFPILIGFLCMFLFHTFFNDFLPGDAVWTLSTQAYINAAAFATGLCPITGVYGKRAGIAAGFICAAMCSSTSALHGGLVLYNGGFTAGLSALILLPILDHYNVRQRRESARELDYGAMVVVQKKADTAIDMDEDEYSEIEDEDIK